MWTVNQEKDFNVHTVKFTYDSTAPLEQYALLCADIHYDNPDCKRELFHEHCQEAKHRNAPIIVGGDFYCLMQGKHDRRRTKGKTRPEHDAEDYFDRITDTTANELHNYPFAVIGMGNHESSVLRNSNTNMTNRLATKLGCHASGYMGAVDFNFRFSGPNSTGRGETKSLYFNHTSGGGGIVTRGAIRTNRMLAQTDGFDIIMMGHIHESWIMETPVWARYRGRMIQKTIYHVQCGTYKDEFKSGVLGWATEKTLPPKPLGAWWVKFTSKNKRLKINFERAD